MRKTGSATFNIVPGSRGRKDGQVILQMVSYKTGDETRDWKWRIGRNGKMVC